MHIEYLDHIHIAVLDLDKAVDFFEKLFDIRFGDEIVIKEWSARARIASLGPLVGIELIQPTSPQSIFAKFIEKRGQGLQAISLKVRDLEEAKKEMQERGMRLVNSMTVGRVKEAQFHPKDAFGVLIEICEYPSEHPASKACLH